MSLEVLLDPTTASAPGVFAQLGLSLSCVILTRASTMVFVSMWPVSRENQNYPTSGPGIYFGGRVLINDAVVQ